MRMNTTLTRRSFLKAGTGMLALSLLRLEWGVRAGEAAEANGLAESLPEYRGWEDLYRQRWVWDRVAKGTHYVNCWYQRGCNWNVYVKDGIAWREEQAATYPRTNTDVPDFNPRGCQKGACYSQRMYDAARLRYPLKRAGARGEGKWQRISWEQALGEIAETTLNALTTDGPASIVWDSGGSASNGCFMMGLNRTNHILDTQILELNAELGDHHPGAGVTCGKIFFASSADDLFYSDLVLIWGGNPTYTQIPGAHFINEARYHGARVVAIAPDYNASSIHADLWVPLNIATDAALGLALAHVIIEEGLYARAFVTEQTDLPLLVRTDTGAFLRTSDFDKSGAADIFYVFDQATKQAQKAPKSTLALGALDPALEGEFAIDTLHGKVTVTPVFALLRKHLSRYSPEQTARTTGVAAATARNLARAIAKAKAVTCMTQSNFSKFYHGLEMERAQILVLALSGHIGKKGAGLMAFPNLHLAGVDDLHSASGALPLKQAVEQQRLALAPEFMKMKREGFTDAMVVHELGRQGFATGSSPSSTLMWYFHAGLDALNGRSKEWDPHLKRELREYLDEALAKGWQFAPKGRPRILFEVGGNLLRRIRGYHKLVENLLPKLDLLVTVDTRMSNTALHSDYVLPAAAWYEKDDILVATTPILPFAQVTTQATPPLAEAKSDWEFHCLLMKELQTRASASGRRTFKDRSGRERRLDRVYDEMTFNRQYTEENPKELLDEILSLATNVGDVRWSELERKGFTRFTGVGTGYMTVDNATDIQPDETITANTWHTERKEPWPTLTRRMQFYIDHEWYRELGEMLPVHKDQPPIGGNHPLQMTSGHTRWSIHSSWRDSAHMLRLGRGEPVMFIGQHDAEARGITDGDRVSVYNDIGSFELQTKVSASLRPGQVVVYHAWEPYQFAGGRSQVTVTPNPINPIQLAGGYFHLQPRFSFGGPGSSDRATRVEVARLTANGAQGHRNSKGKKE
jgi:DMSO reductase family type II enzyme molybdopterin subunit